MLKDIGYKIIIKLLQILQFSICGILWFIMHINLTVGQAHQLHGA